MTRMPDASVEQRRLEALDELHVLDSDAEPEFDAIVEEATRLCDMPMGAIALVGEHRQWFKALRGIDLVETPREVAFCAVTVADDAPLLVPDTHLDPRFADNPFVLGAPHLRAYFGVPLRLPDGSVLGALSVMDSRARTLAPDKVDTLRALADQVIHRLLLRERMRRIRSGDAGALLRQMELETRELEHARELAEASGQVAHYERLYRSLWETTTDAVLILEVDSTIVYANPGAERMFGYPPGALDGQGIEMLQPGHLRERHVEGMQRYLDTGVRRVDWRGAQTLGLRADGSVFDIEISFSDTEVDGRRLFVGFIRDVSARQQIVRDLHAERARLASTLRCIGDGVVTLDAGGAVRSLNPMAIGLVGWDEADALGRAVDDVLRLERDGQAFLLSSLLVPRGGIDAAALPSDATLRTRDGRALSVEGSVAELLDARGRLEGWVIAVRDVTDARALADRVAFDATHDALTGLQNRAAFDARLRDAVHAAATAGVPSSLLYLDLDQFKIVNDTCGHIAGDELLKQLALLLRSALRRNDALARLGGDEFGVLLDGCPAAQALTIAQSLRSAVQDFVFTWQGQPFRTGVSIGHVHFEDGMLQPHDVLSRADEACYVAKDLGRNRIHTFRPDEEIQARLHGEMRWVGALRAALDEDRFELLAQPVHAVADAAAPPWYEMLLRLRGEDGALVPPMSFLPAAERYDLMPTLDRWVLRRALGLLSDARNAGARVPCIAVNLSGATLRDAAFAEYAEAELRRHALPAHSVVLEITETVAVGNFADAIRLIEALRAAGYRFALDDFGSGLSSFTYLRRLPVDLLKIDGSFVRGIVDDSVDRAMVASINEIGHLMGLRTVAEFVEHDAILGVLRAIGVDYAQGYGLGRPAPFAEWLAIGGRLPAGEVDPA